MKIKTKLLGIFVLIIIITAASLGVFAAFNMLQKQIQSEKLIITELKDQLYKEAAHINELCYTSVNTSLLAYKEITQNTVNSFKNISNITYLQKNKSITESLDQIKQMDAYMTTRRDRLFGSAAAFTKAGETLGLNTLSMSLCDFLPLQYHTNKPAFIPYLEAAAAYTGSIRIMSQSLAEASSANSKLISSSLK